MEKYINVIYHVNKLSETCLEGIIYLQKQLNQKQLDSTIILLCDLVTAFFVMEKSLQPMLPLFDSQHLENLILSIWDSIDFVLSAYERNDENKALYVVTAYILPKFTQWKHEIENTFYPYIYS
jgi:hypothetical protein